MYKNEENKHASVFFHGTGFYDICERDRWRFSRII